MQETIYSVSEAVGILELQSHVLRYWEEEMKLPITQILHPMGYSGFVEY